MSERLVAQSARPGRWEKASRVLGGVGQHGGRVVETPAQLVYDPGVLVPDAVVLGLLEDGAHQGGDHALRGSGHPR